MLFIQSPNPSLIPRGLFAGILAAIFIWLLVAGPTTAHAIFPERRRIFEERRPNEYLIFPAIASIPGVGVFLGVIGAATNIGDTGINLAGALAESIDDSDISVRAIAVQDVPLWRPALTFDYQIANIKLGNLETYLPGRNSPNFTIPVTGEFNFQRIQVNLRSSERRFNAWYSLSFFEGFDFDENGNEVSSARHGALAGILLDLTDDVVDPRVGVRIGYQSTLKAPSNSILGENSGPEGAFGSQDDIRILNYLLSLYIPLTDQLFLAWANLYFEAQGREDTGQIVPGGSPPLRGYPARRWSDRFGVFSGMELRYTISLGRNLDFLLVSGILEEVQFAVFYEVGQVSPEKNSSLYDDMHRSYGGGVRVLFEATVLRFDLALSDEGPQTHLTIGQAF